MPFPRDSESVKTAQGISKTMLAIYQRAELYESFSYLFEELRSRSVKVDVLHASYVDIGTGAVLPLVEITRDGQVLLLEKRYMDFRDMPEALVNNPETPAFSIISERQEGKSDTWLVERYDEIRSILTVRLIMKETVSFYCSLFSEQPDAFTPEEGEFLLSILTPFSGILSYMLPASSQPDNPVDIEEDLPLLTQGSAMAQVWKQVQKVAGSDTTVLVMGETGTGKELVARALHSQSTRRHYPLVVVNCGAIAESLMDSELFGHERGAFTGAANAHAGFFEQAHGGTLFLDEVGELSLSAQVRLLRVLERKEITRVGGQRPVKIDVRVVAATNRDLLQMVEDGSFRRDLWFRINAFPIQVPTLRERRLDIVPLTHFFIVKYAKKMGLTLTQGPSADEFIKLCLYDWPGNVRELEHVVEHALISGRVGSTCGKIQFDLPAQRLSSPSQQSKREALGALLLPGSLASGIPPLPTSAGIEADFASAVPPDPLRPLYAPVLPSDSSSGITTAHNALSPGSAMGTTGQFSFPSRENTGRDAPVSLAGKVMVDVSDWPSLDEETRRYIRIVLEKTRGRIEGPKGAATLLGMHPNTLRSKMVKLGIEFRGKTVRFSPPPEPL